MDIIETILDELKQYDLKKINLSDVKSTCYYLIYNYDTIRYFYYQRANYPLGFYFPPNAIIYEFTNKSFNNHKVITETFFNFTHNLKNTKQKVSELNKKKFNAIYLKICSNTDQVNFGTDLLIGLSFKELINLNYSSYKITKNKTYSQFNKDFTKFIKKSKFKEQICYYY